MLSTVQPDAMLQGPLPSATASDAHIPIPVTWASSVQPFAMFAYHQLWYHVYFLQPPLLQSKRYTQNHTVLDLHCLKPASDCHITGAVRN